MVLVSNEWPSTEDQPLVAGVTTRKYLPYKLNDLLTLSASDGSVCVRLIYIGKYDFALGRVVSMEGDAGDMTIGEIVVVSDPPDACVPVCQQRALSL